LEKDVKKDRWSVQARSLLKIVTELRLSNEWSYVDPSDDPSQVATIAKALQAAYDDGRKSK
jgi:hypothetical protein